MIDLHSHLLPELDDGSKSLEMSLQMARIAVADGIRAMACTPHILPGVYDNQPLEILEATERLKRALRAEGIQLGLVPGADIHAVPDLVARLHAGRVPTLGGGRYFLFEPPHHVAPPGLLDLTRETLAAGYIPVLTHPERLTWIEKQYDLICAMDEAGAALQLTAASITGGFGDRARYWSLRMLDEGRVDIVATDAHHPRRRPPILSEARNAVAERCGEDSARRLFWSNPHAILLDKDLAQKQRTPLPGPPPSLFRLLTGRK